VPCLKRAVRRKNRLASPPARLKQAVRRKNRLASPPARLKRAVRRKNRLASPPARLKRAVRRKNRLTSPPARLKRAVRRKNRLTSPPARLKRAVRRKNRLASPPAAPEASCKAEKPPCKSVWPSACDENAKPTRCVAPRILPENGLKGASAGYTNNWIAEQIHNYFKKLSGMRRAAVV